jgi:hypothetical protein
MDSNTETTSSTTGSWTGQFCQQTEKEWFQITILTATKILILINRKLFIYREKGIKTFVHIRSGTSVSK